MKVAIVTGASRGIGACVAEGLAAEGYSVALVARSKEALEQLANKIAGSKGKDSVLTYVIDVQDHAAVEAMIASVMSKWKRIDLLFNNAGQVKLGSVDLPIEDFDRIIAVNLRGAFSFLQTVVPIMKAQKSGTIINVASRAGKVGFAGYGTYGASKFGLVGLSESLYRELAPLGIKVTALCPSWVDTDMAKESGLPQEEMIESNDIFKTVQWLLTLSPASVVREVMIECRKQTD